MRNSKTTLKIGYENMVSSHRILAIVNPNSAPIKRMIKQAKERMMLIDATGGKPTRSAIIADTGHVILSSISPAKLERRMNGRGTGEVPITSL